MRLDDRVADREPHPHAEWFGRYEGLEDRVRHLGGDSGPESATEISMARLLLWRASITIKRLSVLAASIASIAVVSGTLRW